MVLDLSVVSAVEFEELCRDLLAAEFGFSVASFAPGPDGGIDLRWAPGPGRRAIGQCKHYAKSGYAALMRSLREHELAKVRTLSPDEYWVMTSVEMTPARKQKIFDLFRPWMPTPDHVLGPQDIDGLLRQHPQVLRHNIKLLIRDSERLATFLHGEVYNRTADRIERINEALHVYVATDAHQEARALLNQHRVCIVSGEPGAGKSTLAQMLMAEAIHDGYEPVDLGDGISHAWTMLRPGSRQVFFYDDFLGELRFDWLNRNMADIVRFIERVARSTSTLLVMTTREYILRDAAQVREQLARLDPKYRYVLAVGALPPAATARILFNHLWHAGLPGPSVRAVAGQDLSPVVWHDSFNPRVIEACTTREWVADGTDYAQRLVEALDHPDDLWETAFTEYLDDAARLLLYCMACDPGDAKVVADDFFRAAKAMSIVAGDHSFRRTLEVLDGTFIRVFGDRDGQPRWIRFHNPSIREFVLRKLCGDRESLRALMDTAEDVATFVMVWEELVDNDQADPAIAEAVRQAFKDGLRRVAQTATELPTALWLAAQLNTAWSPGRTWLEEAVERCGQWLWRRRDCAGSGSDHHLPLLEAFAGDRLQARLHAAADEDLSPFGKRNYSQWEWATLAEHMLDCSGFDAGPCTLDVRLLREAFEYYAQAVLSEEHDPPQPLALPRDLDFSTFRHGEAPAGLVTRLRMLLGFQIEPHPDQLPLFEIAPPTPPDTVDGAGLPQGPDGPNGVDALKQSFRQLFARLLDSHTAEPHDQAVPTIASLPALD